MPDNVEVKVVGKELHIMMTLFTTAPAAHRWGGSVSARREFPASRSRPAAALLARSPPLGR